jgi:hypothetical protein
MQLYKSRDFSGFFQDTFAFLTENGKHFFKHFIIINGAFVLVLMALAYFFAKFYTDILFGGILNQGDSAAVIDSYMNNNFGQMVLLVLLFIVVALVAGIISYAYTPFYLKLHNEKGPSNFNTATIINLYKANLGKLFIFLVCAILVAIPLFFVMGIISFVLMITIIGIIALPLVIGAVSLYYNMTLFEYIENKKGIWESFGYSWDLMSSKFWAAVGSVGLFYLMSYVIQNVIAIIPYVFGMASIFSTFENGVNNDQSQVGGSFMVIMLIVFLLTFLVSSFLGLIVQLNQGIVFYSLKEDNENITTKSDIDEIGSGE